MTISRILVPIVIGAAVIAGGLTAARLVLWLLAEMSRRLGDDDNPVGTPRVTQPVTSAKEADAIRARAGERHERADERHQEGNAIESGEPPAGTYHLKAVGGRR